MAMNDTLTNQSAEINSSQIYLHQFISRILLGCFLFGLSLITVLGNLLVFYAIRTEKRLRTVSNLFILSLAFADFIVGCIVMPLSAAYIIFDHWPFSTFLCQMWLSIDYVASTASIFNLILLSFDRYWAVVHPLQYLQSRSRKRASYCLILIWLVSSLWAPAILFWSSFYPESSDRLPPSECDTSFRSNKLFKTLTALGNFYLPLLTMILISCRIMIAIRSRSTMEFGRRISSTVQKRRRREKKQTMHVATSEPEATRRERSSEQGTDSGSARGKAEEQYSQLKPMEIFFPSFKSNREAQRRSEVLPRSYSTEVRMRNSSSVEDNMKYYDRESSSSLFDEPLSSVSSPLATRPIPSIILPPAHDIDPVDRVHILTFFDFIVDPSLSRSLKKELKAARQLGFLVGVFTITWLPYFILFVVVAWCPHCVPGRIYVLVVWLGYTNSTLNPFIYPLCNKHFRHAFRKIFYCQHAKIKLPNLDELHELHALHAIGHRR